jgi:aromatic ring-opening dioxygenase LigB subunit
LVLGDGSNRHGPRAPGSEDERAPSFDDAVAKALAKADAEALLALDPALADELGAGGRVPWQVLAGVGDSWRAELLYSAAPFGVGYHVAVWERG